MKKIIFLLSIIGMCSVNFFSQDNIWENIKGAKISSSSQKQSFSRKGLNLGIHFTPGKGRISYVNDKDNGFGWNFGADLNIYFNETMGLKTGVSYQKLLISPGIRFTDNFGTVIRDGLGELSSILFPLKFQITSKGNIGIYLESGMNFIISVDGGIDGFSPEGGNYTPIVFASETAVGINIKASEKVSLNLGGSYRFSFNDYLKGYDEYKGRLLGFQMGVLFKLAK